MKLSKKNRKKIAKVGENFGKKLNRTFTAEEMDRLQGCFLHEKSESDFSLDDITWKDLHLDRFYQEINHAYSSAGDEVLYRLLRTPVIKDDAELAERKRLIHFFETKDDERNFLAWMIGRLGRRKKISLVETLDKLAALTEKVRYDWIFHTLLLPLSVGIMFLSTTAGTICILLSIIYNLYSYYKKKQKAEEYYLSVASFARLATIGGELGRLSIPELQAYFDLIRADSRKLQYLKKHLFWLGEGAGNTFSNNLFHVLMDYVRMMTHLDFYYFSRMISVIRSEKESIRELYRTIGYLEAMISIASYRRTLPYYTEGRVGCSETELSVTALYHPFVAEPVANSLSTDRPILLTGSNASGKSTFLRSVGVAALFSQTIVTVPAKAYSGPYFALYTSMSLSDDIRKKESYFTTEIKSLKRIFDGIGETKVLALADEVLRGTNTIERIAASSQLLKALAAKNTLCFAATHDRELTALLADIYRNYHFTEAIEEETVRFTYQLATGPATTRNAIRLLSAVGFDPAITDNALSMTDAFEEDGIWKML